MGVTIPIRRRRSREGEQDARPPGGSPARTSAGHAAGTPRYLQGGSVTATHAAPGQGTQETSGPVPASSHGATDWASQTDRPACCDHLDDARAWASGAYGPRTIIGAGGRGGFTAWYFPFYGPGVLHLTQSIAAAFKDLLVDGGGSIQPHPDLPAAGGMTALAARIDALPEPDRTNALSAYQWSGAAEERQWLGELESVVEGAWGFQHTFFLNQPCWEWIGASVNVDLRLHIGEKGSGDHMDLETYKTPAGESLRTHGVSHRVSHGSGTDAFDQSMRLASTTTGEKEYDLLRESVEFGHNSDVLTSDAQIALHAFIQEYDGATAHPAFSRSRIDLIGRTSSSGSEEYNQDLAERRAEAVRSFLETHGLTDAPLRVHVDARGESEADQTTDDPGDRRVDLLVDGGQRMVTASHEFGHAFGLGDEYAGKGRPVGSDAGHHTMATKMTDATGTPLPGAAVEHTGGIMSFGNEVRPQHYATFHHALTEVTGKSPWSLGTRTPPATIESVCGGGGVAPCTGDTCVAASPTPDGPATDVA